MSYYKGDFYRGDFYRGDPGFFSFLGKIAKTAVGFIPGVGPIASKAIDVGTSIVKGTGGGRAGQMVRAGVGAVVKHPVLSAAGAAGVIGAGTGIVRRGRMGSGGTTVHVAGARHHRRMHVTNVKALRRAIRRAKGFERLARRVMSFTSARPPRGRAHFKIRRRKKI